MDENRRRIPRVLLRAAAGPAQPAGGRGRGRGSGGGGGGACGSGGGGGGGGRGQKRRRAAVVVESGSEEEPSEESDAAEDLDDEAEAEYKVEDVLDMRTTAGGGREFLIRWEGYSGSDTWEPQANLRASLVREYMEARAAEEQPEEQPEQAADPDLAVPAESAAPASGGRTGAKGKAAKKRLAPKPPAAPSRKRAAAAPAPAPLSRFAALEVGASMEVQGCSAGCDFVCSVCEWEECTIVTDHGETCDVRIDGVLYEGVQRRHVRELAHAVHKRAVAAAAREAPPPPKRARAPAPAPAPSRPARPASRKGKGR